jgi:hypothetical protein
MSRPPRCDTLGTLAIAMRLLAILDEAARGRGIGAAAARAGGALAAGADGRARLKAFSLPTGTRSPSAAASSQLPVTAQMMPSGVFFAVCAKAAPERETPSPAATMMIDRIF